MRVLVLSPLLPATGGSGGQTRELHLLAGLVRRGHEVTVLCPLPADQVPLLASAEAAGLRIRTAPRPSSRVAETLAALRDAPSLPALAAVRPLAAWQLEILVRPLLPMLAEELARQPDVALLVWDHAAAWRRFLPGSLPTVVDLHDASWVYLRERGRTTGGLAGAALRADARRLRRFVARRLGGLDGVVCVSDADAEHVRAATGVTPTVVDNGVDLDADVPAATAALAPTVLFTGTLDYAPNDDGARWLATAIWPHVRRALPDARLHVVGRNPSAALLAADGVDGVRVPGGVASMAPWFADAHVAAVPIRSGGGTRLKILEAAAARRAVVTTARGVEGLHLADGSDVVVAPAEPEAFAAALVALLGNAERRDRLAASARAIVEARYGWPALAGRLEAVLAAAAGQPVGGSSARTTDQ